MVSSIKTIIQPHGLIASWFLTWFVHEFTDFRQVFQAFDFQLQSGAGQLAPVYLAAAMLILDKPNLTDWQDDEFERIVRIRNLPRECKLKAALECARVLHRKLPSDKLLQFHPELRNHLFESEKEVFILPWRHFGTKFWVILVLIHVIYLIWWMVSVSLKNKVQA